MAVSLKNGGVWKDLATPYVRNGGSWVEATNIYVRTAGAWEEVYPSFPPPTLRYTGEMLLVSGKNTTEVRPTTTYVVEPNTNFPSWIGWTGRTQVPDNLGIRLSASTFGLADAVSFGALYFMASNEFYQGFVSYNDAGTGIDSLFFPNPLAYVQLYRTNTYTPANLMETWTPMNQSTTPNIMQGNKDAATNGFEGGQSLLTSGSYYVRIFA